MAEFFREDTKLFRRGGKGFVIYSPFIFSTGIWSLINVIFLSCIISSIFSKSILKFPIGSLSSVRKVILQMQLFLNSVL